ncbi:MAG: class I SAM-dependent methyltransferase [Francisella sp.]
MRVNIFNLEVKDHIEKIIEKELECEICQKKNDKYLYLDKDILKLNYNDKDLFIDFNTNDILNRINPKSKKCNVVKAIEGRSKNKLKILDTTAGLGRDTFTLAARGHTLVSLEKDIYVYLLLKDALQRAKNIDKLGNIANRITLLNVDSNEYIHNDDIFFDCVYIDPMFPKSNKSAKVKKGMQILQNIGFNDESSNAKLLYNTLNLNITTKAVVKRHINSSFLYDKKPSYSIKGKTNRFDVYIV